MKRGFEIKKDSKALQDDFIKIFIDDKECYAKQGDSILNVARENGINIPTLCDLKKLTPTGACRMCIVEECDGNVIASCKSFVNAPSRFYTQTEKLQKYRNQIMSFLCINHPLECGVCDKSGECELQDRVLESKVEIQPFFAIQKQNDYVSFHNKVYNESLCIMCERCARTCNEYVGNSVLSVLAGGFHSKIGVDFNAYCEDCDECVSVCPTGAMFSTRFTYTSNAWELEKHESSCLHCSLHCPLFYEVKHNIDSRKEVYRITNEAHINQLCHAGRHNFMRQNLLLQNFIGKDGMESSLTKDCVFEPERVLENVSALRIGSNVTNEEAYIANLVAQKANKKIYCNEALHYREFSVICNHYGVASNARVLQDLDHNHVVIVLGGYLYDEMPILRSNLAKAALKKGTKNVWISTIAEDRFQSDLSITYEVGSELAISTLLLSLFEEQIKQSISALESSNEKHKLDLLKSTLVWLQEQDIGYIMAESNVSDHEIEILKTLCMQYKPLCDFVQTSSIKILVGQDFYLSKHYKVIAQILCAIAICQSVIYKSGQSGMCDGECEIIPLCYDNIHAIATICDLSFDSGEYDNVLGIRANAAYTISSRDFVPFADSVAREHFALMPLQFMEGSYIDLYCNLVKIYPSFTHGDDFRGDFERDLLDMFGEYLGLECDYMVDITEMLPFIPIVPSLMSITPAKNALSYNLPMQTAPKQNMKSSGLWQFLQKKDFDSLKSPEVLKSNTLLFLDSSFVLQKYPEISLEDGSGIFIYRAALSGNLSFYRSEYDDECLSHNDERLHGILRASRQFCMATKLKDWAVVSLQIGDKVLRVRVLQTAFMKGMVSVLVSDSIIDSTKYFDYKSIEV